MLSSAIWGPAICKACWNSSLPNQQRSAATHILKQIINEDLSSLRSFCSSLYFTDETDGTRPKLFWTQEVWNYLLGEANLAKGISHIPHPLQQVIFCTHSDVALLDTEHMPELELQDGTHHQGSSSCAASARHRHDHHDHHQTPSTSWIPFSLSVGSASIWRGGH